MDLIGQAANAMEPLRRIVHNKLDETPTRYPLA
jgi:hypothetical protein